MTRDSGEFSSIIPSSRAVKWYKEKRQGKWISYANLSISFDLESFSFLDHGEKRAVMWAWGISIGEDTYIGRTWGDFVEALLSLSEEWALSDVRRCIIYVHNLSYDFQFFRRWADIDEVFAIDSRKVCTCFSSRYGVEFRCSYLLTGYSLELVGKRLQKYRIEKLAGTIDYELPRHPGTPLTREEVEYLAHDCLVVTAHIQECIEAEGKIVRIPLTKTGYVRRYVRGLCFKGERGSLRYRTRYMDNLQITDSHLYRIYRDAFYGGYTHSNPAHSGEEMKDVTSYDFTSSYPTVLISELFPMGAPVKHEHIEKEDFYRLVNTSRCIFTVSFKNLEATFNSDFYLSRSRCYVPKETPGGEKNVVQESNGRIVKAGYLACTITEQDFKIICRNYRCKGMHVGEFYTFPSGYLPKPIIEAVLSLYYSKSTLKGVEGREAEYQRSKEDLNSLYGMMVQKPVTEEHPYIDGEWGKSSPLDIESVLKGYNENPKRFTAYVWGIYVTAYARKNLWSGIFECGDDYIYSDTDSLKILHAERHRDYIEEYNRQVTEKIKRCLDFYSLPYEKACPDIDGVKKPMGVWDYDGHYKRFKTLGAKRYLYQADDGSYHLTVAGLGKKAGLEYLLSLGPDPFTHFNSDLKVPAGHAGKLTHTYVDKESRGCMVDYRGEKYFYHELSYVYMEPAAYDMHVSQSLLDYIEYLIGEKLDEQEKQ